MSLRLTGRHAGGVFFLVFSARGAIIFVPLFAFLSTYEMRLSKSLFCVAAAHVAFRENLVKSVETNLKLAQNYIKVLMFMTKTAKKN